MKKQQTYTAAQTAKKLNLSVPALLWIAKHYLLSITDPKTESDTFTERHIAILELNMSTDRRNWLYGIR